MGSRKRELGAEKALEKAEKRVRQGEYERAFEYLDIAIRDPRLGYLKGTYLEYRQKAEKASSGLLYYHLLLLVRILRNALREMDTQ